MTHQTHTVFVCTSCGAKADKPSKGLGKTVFARLQDALGSEDAITVQPIGCLSNCTRGASVAFAAPDKFAWVFGEQSEDDDDIAKIAQAARLYATLPDGFIAKEDRPRPVIARIPPFGFRVEGV